MVRTLVLAVLMLAMFGTASAPAQHVAGWTGAWVQAPWASVRDGAEVDGSRPMPVFRREFTVKGKVRKATLRIAGLGQWEAHLGRSGETLVVGGKGLHQAWTDYRKTVRFESYDVTGAMRPGRMVLGVMLGNGMYNVQRSSLSGEGAAGKARYTKFEGSFGPPKLIAELRVEYADGQTQVVATDGSWQVSRGPVVFDSTYGGEDYDARRDQRGWDQPGFQRQSGSQSRRGPDEAGWSAVQVVAGPGGALRGAVAPEVVQQQVYRPIATRQIAPGIQVYDLGQNFAGIPAVRVTGPAGAVLRITPGELVNADGTVTQRSSGGPMWWSYTLRGHGGAETWSPLFDYYGFRYLQVEWIGAAKGTVENVAGIGLHSASQPVGTFASSNEWLNRIHALIVAAMHNNEVSLLTDCPHREKLGWLEQTHLVAAGLMFNNDLEGLYRATEDNIADAQQADGMVPTIAPQYTKFGPKYAIYDDSPEWGSAAVLAPWAAYRLYGDRAELTLDYPLMQRYVAYLAGRAVDGIVAYGLGDWYDIGPGGPGFEKNTTLGVTGTLTLYQDARAMERIAEILGKPEDVARYHALAEKTSAAFNRRFWNAAKGWYDTGSQTANAMPLELGVVPEDRRAEVLAHVVADIRAHQDHVTTGEIGFPYLLQALMAAGRDDVVMALMMRKDPPSYGDQLVAGATSLTEAWDANRLSSQDHFMLGAGEEWFYRGLGGIDVDFSRAQRIVVRPRVVSGVDWVRVGFDSKLGRVESDWRRVGAKVELEVTVPVAAQVQLPGGQPMQVQAGLHRFDVTMP